MYDDGDNGPYGSQGCTVPRLMCRFGHCIKCLLAYLTSPLTFLLLYSLSYFSSSLRIGPFCFQAGHRKRRLSLALVFCVLTLCCCMFWYACMFHLVVLDLVFICHGLVCIFVFLCQLLWSDGVMVRVLAHDTKGCGFDSRPFHFQ